MRKTNDNEEDAISGAARSGAFDRLPGSGKPLNLEGYLEEDPDTRVAHRMLRRHGFSLPWIEEMKEIEKATRDARLSLSRAWSAHEAAQASGKAGDWTEARWRQAVEEFRTRAAEINSQILTFNLKVPMPCFQKSRLNIEREIEAAQKVSGTTDEQR